jgi:hypothetical protein
MAIPEPLVKNRFVAGKFLDTIEPEDLVYFLLNIGDADAQVVLLPEWQGERRLVIVDAGVKKKVPALLDALAAAGLVDLTPTVPGENRFPIALFVATHPHDDHIAGAAEVLDRYPDLIAELWEPGFIHTAACYTRLMTAVEKHTKMIYTQPTSGMQRWLGHTGITVLAPSINLRNRYDTYGVDINDSSIVLRIEHPSARVTQTNGQRNYQPTKNAATLVLGADAQTLSWSYTLTDFPMLQKSSSATAKKLDAAKGDWNLLKGAVLKVSHHASKHGINLELVERVQPKLTLTSCAPSGTGTHGFPHTVAQDIIREALQPIAGSKEVIERKSDAALGVFYTGDTLKNKGPVGSMAVVMRGNKRTLWRFFDAPSDEVDLTAGMRWTDA